MTKIAPPVLCFTDCSKCDATGSSSYGPVERTCTRCDGRGEIIAHGSDEICSKCCDHDDVDEDDRTCCNCGKDMTEILTARAESARELLTEER